MDSGMLQTGVNACFIDLLYLVNELPLAFLTALRLLGSNVRRDTMMLPPGSHVVTPAFRLVPGLILLWSQIPDSRTVFHACIWRHKILPPCNCLHALATCHWLECVAE